MKKLALSIALILFCAPFLTAQGQIEFVAQILEVIPDGVDPETGTLNVSLIPGTELQVLVTNATEIEDEDGDPALFSELLPGTSVKIEGIFTAQGILALEIQIGSEAAEFELRGQIQAVRDDVREIEVNGFVIHVPVEAEIKMHPGTPLLFDDLEVGQFVKVEGNISDEQLFATEVKVVTAEAAIARVRFEGIVSEIDGEIVHVTIEGVGAVRVQVTPETDIEGELAVGRLVRVWGRLSEGLGVEATRIVVVPYVRLAPRQLKMKFEETKTVHVVLQALQEGDVELTLTSLDPDIAEPAVQSIVIPAGTLNGTFDVDSKALEGLTTIEVGLPASLGGGNVPLPVEVRDRPVANGTELRIRWLPGELHLGTESFRRVVLQLNHPAEGDVEVALALEEGPADLVQFPAQVLIPAGERRVGVEILTGPAPGKARIEAVLPDSAGGDSDVLEVEVRTRRPERHALRWTPPEVTVSTGQTFTAKLEVSAAAPADLEIRLSANPRDARLVLFPEEVTIPAGESEVEVEFQARDMQGTARVMAYFPFRKGGDQDILEIRIQ